MMLIFFIRSIYNFFRDSLYSFNIRTFWYPTGGKSSMAVCRCIFTEKAFIQIYWKSCRCTSKECSDDMPFKFMEKMHERFQKQELTSNFLFWTKNLGKFKMLFFILLKKLKDYFSGVKKCLTWKVMKGESVCLIHQDILIAIIMHMHPRHMHGLDRIN